MTPTKLDVLDKGYVRLSRIMADILEDGSLRAVTDNSVADDARVSFAKSADNYTDEENARVVNFLGSAKPVPHTSPFRGCIVQFEVKAPMFVRNQWYKYVIGSHHEDGRSRDPFQQWNEVSRRYVSRSLEFYIPTQWREAPEIRKQGSGSIIPEHDRRAKRATGFLEGLTFDMVRAYEEFVNSGICPEQARLVLPAYGLYTTWRWTASLQTVCHFLTERLADDAQSEIRMYAQAVHAIIEPLFPRAVNALVKGLE